MGFAPAVVLLCPAPACLVPNDDFVDPSADATGGVATEGGSSGSGVDTAAGSGTFGSGGATGGTDSGTGACEDDDSLGFLPTLEVNEQYVAEDFVWADGVLPNFGGTLPVSAAAGRSPPPEDGTPTPIVTVASEGPLLEVCTTVVCEGASSIDSVDCPRVSNSEGLAVECCAPGQVEVRYVCEWRGTPPETAVIWIAVRGPECTPFTMRYALVE